MPNWKKLVVSGSDARLNSLFTDGPITGSSFSGDGSGLTNIQSSSFATQALTASFALNAGGGTGVGFPFSGSAVITGSLQVDEFASSPLLVQPNSLSSDVVVPDSSSGLLFGDTSISGSLTIPVSSKLFYLNLDAIAYTSSQVQSALTASYFEGSVNSANTSISASFATSALTASFATSTISASFATSTISASFATSTISSSYSDFALSASYAVSSSHEITLEVSSSFADTSISSSYSLSSSLATSSSISETVTNQNSSSGSLSFWQGSQLEYNAISASADPNTIYFVV